MSVAFVKGAGWVSQDTEQQPGRVPHHLPGVDALYPPGAQVLEAGHLGIQVIGVDIQVHARDSFAQALGQQPEVLAVQGGTVVLRVAELLQLMAEGRLPERELALVVVGWHVDDDLEQPAEVGHDANLRGWRRNFPAVLEAADDPPLLAFHHDDNLRGT